MKYRLSNAIENRLLSLKAKGKIRSFDATTILVLVLSGISLALSTSANGQDDSLQLPHIPLPSIQVNRILNDIRELSHTKYQGRQAGTDGGRQSADFIAKRFHTLGLKPIRQSPQLTTNDDWFHEHPLTATQVGSPALISLSFVGVDQTWKTRHLTPGPEVLPALDSPSASLMAPVIFVGYGIVDPARGMNDYQGIDVQNRTVLFLRGKPPSYARWVTHEEKTATAKTQGALGYITVTGPLLDRYEARKGLGQTPLGIHSSTSPDHYTIPGVWIEGKVLTKLLSETNESLETLQLSANNFRAFRSHPLPLLAQFDWTSLSYSGSLINVLGFLPGRDPHLGDDLILIAAHRDHFGLQAGLLFSGADDNASGTAVMLEVARILSQSDNTPRRSILFVSFDGEERGLLGSTLYSNNPVHPLSKTYAMINLDHLGVGNGKITVGVTRMEKALAQLAAERTGLRDHVQIYGYFPGGDHVPFYEKGVPTITVVSDGIHPHYHQPSDTVGTIQPAVLQTTAQYVLTLITLLANLPANSALPLESPCYSCRNH